MSLWDHRSSISPSVYTVPWSKIESCEVLPFSELYVLKRNLIATTISRCESYFVSLPTASCLRICWVDRLSVIFIFCSVAKWLKTGWRFGDCGDRSSAGNQSWICRRLYCMSHSLSQIVSSERVKLEIGLLHDVPIAKSVNTEPLTSDDWEIMVHLMPTARLFHID
jgi:hypothetical protein